MITSTQTILARLASQKQFPVTSATSKEALAFVGKAAKKYLGAYKPSVEDESHDDDGEIYVALRTKYGDVSFTLALESEEDGSAPSAFIENYEDETADSGSERYDTDSIFDLDSIKGKGNLSNVDKTYRKAVKALDEEQVVLNWRKGLNDALYRFFVALEKGKL